MKEPWTIVITKMLLIT